VKDTPRHHRARVASLVSKGAPPEQVEAARADLAAANISAYIRRVIEAAPPLTPEQRNRLAAILRPRRGQAGGDHAA
jgi:hypothetical protein